MLNLRCLQIRVCPYTLKQSNCSRGPKLSILAYANSHNIQPAATPREVLGVSQDADIKEIKTAFRKLALQLHPDRETGSESQFIEVLRAYEILIGKAEGKEGLNETDWDFHDWFWRFSMNRSRNRTQSVQSEQNPRKNIKTDFTSQLAGLRQRAAVRAAKQCVRKTENSPINSKSSLEDALCDSAESPSDSGSTSEEGEFNSQFRSNEESRRRSNLSTSEAKESVTHQLRGLKRRSQIRQSL
eukprot:g7844.t1